MKQITDNEFEIKYKLYNDDLMKIAYGYTHNIIDSEDIVHDVF